MIQDSRFKPPTGHDRGNTRRTRDPGEPGPPPSPKAPKAEVHTRARFNLKLPYHFLAHRSPIHVHARRSALPGHVPPSVRPGARASAQTR